MLHLRSYLVGPYVYQLASPKHETIELPHFDKSSPLYTSGFSGCFLRASKVRCTVGAKSKAARPLFFFTLWISRWLRQPASSCKVDFLSSSIEGISSSMGYGPYHSAYGPKIRCNLHFNLKFTKFAPLVTMNDHETSCSSKQILPSQPRARALPSRRFVSSRPKRFSSWACCTCSWWYLRPSSWKQEAMSISLRKWWLGIWPCHNC